MHPYLMQKLAADRIADMHAYAAAQRLARQVRRGRRTARARHADLRAQAGAAGTRVSADPVATGGTPGLAA